MKSTSSTQVLLSLIQNSGIFCARDLALKSGMNEPAVRYHLRKLHAMGLIEEVPNTAPKLTVGPNERLFRKTFSEKNPCLFTLCEQLIRALPSLCSDTDPVEFLCGLLLQTKGESLNHQKKSLNKLVIWLNERNYQAGWEAGKAGPLLYFANCPYRDIRSGNDILCQMDRQLLRELSGMAWELKDFMDWERYRGVCQFVIKSDA